MFMAISLPFVNDIIAVVIICKCFKFQIILLVVFFFVWFCCRPTVGISLKNNNNNDDNNDNNMEHSENRFLQLCISHHVHFTLNGIWNINEKIIEKKEEWKYKKSACFDHHQFCIFVFANCFSTLKTTCHPLTKRPIKL